MGVPENIDALLVKFDITQDYLARIAGVTPGAVTGWRKGSIPRDDAIDNICSHFGLEKDDITSDRYGLAAKEHGGFNPKSRGAKKTTGTPMGLVPKRGRVHAGVLTEPESLEEKGETVLIPQFILDQDPEAFVVGSEGDCMDKVFTPGSDLVVSPRKQVQEGSVVLVCIDGCDAIVRRYHRMVSTLILSPESHNEVHKDIIVTDDSDHAVELIGVIVWFQASKEME